MSLTSVLSVVGALGSVLGTGSSGDRHKARLLARTDQAAFDQYLSEYGTPHPKAGVAGAVGGSGVAGPSGLVSQQNGQGGLAAGAGNLGAGQMESSGEYRGEYAWHDKGLGAPVKWADPNFVENLFKAITRMVMVSRYASGPLFKAVGQEIIKRFKLSREDRNKLMLDLRNGGPLWKRLTLSLPYPTHEENLMIARVGEWLGHASGMGRRRRRAVPKTVERFIKRQAAINKAMRKLGRLIPDGQRGGRKTLVVPSGHKGKVVHNGG